MSREERGEKGDSMSRPYPSFKRTESEKGSGMNVTPVKRARFEYNSSTQGCDSHVEIVKCSNDGNGSGCVYLMRKGSCSYASPYACRALERCSLIKRPIFYSNDITCSRVPTEQEKIDFLKKEGVTAKKKGMRMSRENRHNMLEGGQFAFERPFTLRNSLCLYPQINEFNLSELLPRIASGDIGNSTQFNCHQEEPLVIPHSCYIDDIGLEIRKVSSMKSPFNKFSFFNVATQLSPQLLNEENTEILSISVRTKNNEVLLLKVKRFDDLFNNIKLFCEINQISEELIKPLIMHVLRALNQIYQAMNCEITGEDMEMLEIIKAMLCKTSCEEKRNK